MNERPSWSDYFMTLAHHVASRGTCTRAKVGAVITRRHVILATGYNGSPSGWVHCTDEGCLIVNGHCVRTVHAERNAINQAAKAGVALDGASIYVTVPPCLRCFLDVVSAGIREVRYPRDEIPRSAQEWAIVESWAKSYGIELRGV